MIATDNMNMAVCIATRHPASNNDAAFAITASCFRAVKPAVPRGVNAFSCLQLTMKSSLLAAGLAALVVNVDALRFPVVARRSTELRRRGNVFGVSTLNNTNDFQYFTTITLGGKVYNQVLIDTGR